MDINEIIKELDNSMKKRHGAFKYEEGLIIRDLDEETMSDIADYYIDRGWKYVYYRNIKEEINYNPLVRPTCKFILSNEELEGMDDYTEVSKI